MYIQTNDLVKTYNGRNVVNGVCTLEYHTENTKAYHG